MAAAGAGNQHSPANFNPAPLRTIPPDFRFKTIGQAPGLLRRITTPDPEIPVSASPSPPASPRLDTSQESKPEDQPQMKQKASLLQRIGGSNFDAGAQAHAAGPSQPSPAQRPARTNGPAEHNNPLGTSHKPRQASTKVHPPENAAKGGPKTLPKLNTAAAVPQADNSMDVDPLASSTSGPVSQMPHSLPQPQSAANQNATASSIDQPSGGQTPPVKSESTISTLRKGLNRITEALRNIPTINFEEAQRLVELSREQSVQVHQSANLAHQQASKALVCAQESMKSARACLAAAEEVISRTDAAVASVKGLSGPEHEEKRRQFVESIETELEALIRTVDQQERLQRQRQQRAQRQQASAQVAAPGAPSVPLATTPIASSSAAAPVAPPPAAPTPSGSAIPAAQPNPPGHPSIAEFLKSIEEGHKAFQEQQKRQAEAHEVWIAQQLSLVQNLQNGIAQNHVAAPGPLQQPQVAPAGIASQMPSVSSSAGSSQQAAPTTTVPQSQQIAGRQAPAGQVADDRMEVDDDNKLKRSPDEVQAHEARQRMIKERLEAEKQAAERRRSASQDKSGEVPTMSETEKLQQEEEARRRQAIQRRQVQEQKQLAAADEAKNINARRALMKQASPTEAPQAPIPPKDETTQQATDMHISPPAAKPAPSAGKALSGNVALGGVNEGLEKKKAKRSIADADSDRLIHTKIRTPSQSKPSSPTARRIPLPTDADEATKPAQQIAAPQATSSSIPSSDVPATGLAALPPRPQGHIAVPPPSQKQENIQSIPNAQLQASSIRQQVAQPSGDSQSQPVVIKRDPDEEDGKIPSCNAGAPMTPDSLPSDASARSGGSYPQMKREATIPMLSLPSPPPATPPPEFVTANSQQAVDQQRQQQSVPNDVRSEDTQSMHPFRVPAVTQSRDDYYAQRSDGYERNTRARGPSGSEPYPPPVSVPQQLPDLSPRMPFSLPTSQSRYRAGDPDFEPSSYVPGETDGSARAGSDSGRASRTQAIPESYSSSSLNGDRNNRNRHRPSRRPTDHYSPSPSPPPPPSRTGRPMVPRGDHYSPRRSLSPRPSYASAYPRYPADRSRSRGPLSGNNSRNASPNVYSPTVAYKEPPLAAFTQNRKRSYTSDMPQGPPSRRPRYDDPRDDALQAGPSRYAHAQDARDEWSVMADRAPSPPERNPVPLEQRLQPSAPYDAPQNGGKQSNYQSNNRYNNRRPSDEHYYATSTNSDNRPPPSSQALPAPASSNDNAPPGLLSRLGNGPPGYATNDTGYDSYYQQQYVPNNTSNHNNSNHNNNRGGGARRGRGAGPTTPRAKNPLINRIEGSR